MASSDQPATSVDDTRLARHLGTGDAVVVGLGAMVGAGVFAAFAPAAAAAGAGLLLGLIVAGFVAYCNATSSADLAARYPRAGGTYVYGRERVGALWGFLAGWGFIVGKTASCAAMALTFGAAVWPGQPRVPALAAVATLTAVNLLGVRKTATLTRVLLALVLIVLAAVVVGALGGGTADPQRLLDVDAAPLDILRSAGFLFFAFAGYARIATLGEEVVDPARTIPRAVSRALGLALAIYVAVGVAALMAVEPRVLAEAASPLVAVVEAGRLAGLAPLVRVGAALAALNVLLSLLAGIGRTAFAMADAGDLPRALAAVARRNRTPYLAEVSVAAVVGVVLLAADLRGAIGFSSFGVLTYYAIANASALTLGGAGRRGHHALAIAGLVGCGVLAFALPAPSVLGGLAVFALGAVVWAIRRSRPAALTG